MSEKKWVDEEIEQISLSSTELEALVQECTASDGVCENETRVLAIEVTITGRLFALLLGLVVSILMYIYWPTGSFTYSSCENIGETCDRAVRLDVLVPYLERLNSCLAIIFPFAFALGLLLEVKLFLRRK